MEFYARVLTSMPIRKVARKSSIGGLYVCAGELDIVNLIKIPVICSVSYLNLRGFVLCLEGLSPPKPPVGTGLMAILHFQPVCDGADMCF